ncbi:MAG: filamentous hemagglutinin N-terminal domain-containing protein, partial [Polaromonas sp.]
MNKNLYRIVFNQSRGQLMAVAETAGAQGKAASGQTQGGVSSSSADCGGVGHLNTAFRTLSLCIAVTFAVFVAAPLHVQAQVAADTSAPKAQQPVILQTASGVPQVNIATPSAAGVSRNTYSQFDVNRQGVILNNSRANVLTQLGGYAPGNPMLAAGSARVILNEINSANPSFINGYVEVAGQRAEVVIANPSGININGGGFINASRGTFTTGTPIMNGGSLDGYLVQRGNINISGAGLDASTTDYTGILARAVQANAGIWAKELKVVAGSNQINEAQTTITPISPSSAGTGPAPSFAIDVAQLGGMYAGKIKLIGTEAGVGVSNAGVIGATAGDVVVQSNGWLSNSGAMQAVGDVQITSTGAGSSVTNSGNIYAGGTTGLRAQGSISNSGTIAALGNTSLHSNAAITSASGAVLAAGLDASGNLATPSQLSITAAGALALNGQSLASGDIGISGTQVNLVDGKLRGRNLLIIASASGIDASRASINTQGTLSASTSQTLRTDGASVAAGQLQLTALALSNRSGEIVQSGGGDMTLSLAGQLDNSGGRIAANSQSLTLAASSLSNNDGKIEHAGSGTLAINTGALTNQRGTITSNGDVSLSAAGLTNSQGRISAGQSADITVAGNIDNTDGVLATGQNINLSSAALNNTRGTLQAGRDMALGTTDFNNSAGSVYAAGKLDIASTNLSNSNSGSIYSVGNQSINASAAISNSGVIAAHGNTTITAASLSSAAGSLLGAGIQADGTLTASGNLRITTTQSQSAQGQLLAAG